MIDLNRRPCAAALVAALALPLLAGCLGGRLPARELYRLAPPPAPASPVIELRSEAAAPLTGSLAVLPYVTPGLYGGGGIVFRVGETQYGVYPSREWALPLGDQLGLMTRQILREHPLADGQALYDPPSRRNHTYSWRGVVRNFDEVGRGDTVYAGVHLEAQLVRTADDSVLWSGAASRERRVLRADMPGIVETLSALAHEVISELVADARRSASVARANGHGPTGIPRQGGRR
ncbi:MAG TPA: hypothetical protein VNA89_00800 [Gemmatimonadaceae bacterium]|nr:hypothetical protein [Gemmatimonadaceae bacterium]